MKETELLNFIKSPDLSVMNRFEKRCKTRINNKLGLWDYYMGEDNY